VPVGAGGSESLIQAVRSLDEAGVETSGLGLRRPSLDDVFLALTGHAAEEEESAEGDGKRRRGRRKDAENVERATS
jgi:ABC-2 type transport system ATP-binding protein